MIKSIVNFFKAWRIVKNNPNIFKVVEDIFKFVERTHEEQKPMACEIVLLNMKDGTKISDFVSLWAGVGFANPLERAKQLKAQNVELKRLLTIAKEGNICAEDKNLMDVTLNIFD